MCVCLSQTIQLTDKGNHWIRSSASKLVLFVVSLQINNYRANEEFCRLFLFVFQKQIRSTGFGHWKLHMCSMFTRKILFTVFSHILCNAGLHREWFSFSVMLSDCDSCHRHASVITDEVQFFSLRILSVYYQSLLFFLLLIDLHALSETCSLFL